MKHIDIFAYIAKIGFFKQQVEDRNFTEKNIPDELVRTI